MGWTGAATQRELTRFDRKFILLPSCQDHYPRPEAILWRYSRLAR